MVSRRVVSITLLVVSTSAAGACSGSDPAAPGSPQEDAATTDGSRADGGNVTSDGATTTPDSNVTTDANTTSDSGEQDSGEQDAASDATADASQVDSGSDSSASDADASDASDAQAVSDAADAADAGPTLGACGTGMFELGEYGTYLGKVNVHRPTGGAWSVDSDCSSGGNNNTVAYCQKFWPTASSQVSVPVVGNKPYTAGGGTAPTCGGVYNEVGQAQYACCAPNPCADGFVPVGTYATWSGKVNVHRAATGSWAVDSDCSSGANVNTVAYCQKYWPASSSQVSVTPEAGDKPFTAGGGTAPTCGGSYPGVGQNQFVCCAPR